MNNQIKKIAFITGSSGFIGFHLAMLFLSNDWEVVGLDALTDYYDVNLKKDRQKLLCENSNFHSYEGFIQDTKILNEIRKIINNANGYLTVIKIEEDLKASVDIFTIDPIKYKISEKLKKSFDPKRILNPGKMYSGI